MPKIYSNRSIYWVGFMAFSDYFTHSELSQSSKCNKRELLRKKPPDHLQAELGFVTSGLSIG